MVELEYEQAELDENESALQFREKYRKLIQHHLEIGWRELKNRNVTQEEYRELGERLGKSGLSVNNINNMADSIIDRIEMFARFEGELTYLENLQFGEAGNTLVSMFASDLRMLILDYIELMQRELKIYVKETGEYPEDKSLKTVVRTNWQ